MVTCRFCKRFYPISHGPCCRHCWYALPIDTDRCLKCGHPSGSHRCPFTSSPIDNTAIAFDFDDTIRGLIHALKSSHDLAAGELLARAFAQRIGAVNSQTLLIPVPSHIGKRLLRGYCPTLWLAQRIGLLLGLQTAPQYLTKVRYTKPQKRLSQAQRQTQTSPFKWHTTSLYRPIVLFDDVITSGQTLLNVASTVPACPQVTAWAIARTAEKD